MGWDDGRDNSTKLLPTMTCRLCGEESELIHSHIIPNFFFKPLYGREGTQRQYHELPTDESLEACLGQGGIKEYLLCGLCERKFSDWEKYGREVLFGGVEKTCTPINSRSFSVSGINYCKFKLFLLSILWRSSVSSSVFFKAVSLGPHEPVIRLMLSNNQPGTPTQYGCLILRGLDQKSTPVKDLIISPESIRVDGIITYRYILGGLTFLYFVSRCTPSKEIISLLLDGSGKFVVVDVELYNTELLKEFAVRLKKQGKL